MSTWDFFPNMAFWKKSGFFSKSEILKKTHVNFWNLQKFETHRLSVFGLASSRLRILVLTDTNLWKRTYEIDYFRTIWCGIAIPKLSGIQIPHQIVRKVLISKLRSEFSRVRSSRGKNVRVPCDWLFWTPLPLAFRTQQGPTLRRLLLTPQQLEVPTNCAIGRQRAPASSDIL